MSDTLDAAHDPARWRRVEEIFHAACALAGDERDAYVKESCGADDRMRGELESLLEAHDAAGGFLQGMPGPSSSPLEFAGSDRFRIEAPLGAGGFGAVYRAFDRVRGGEVALKVLRDTDSEGIYRFKREFRSLTGVFHPNLVELHELFCEAGHWFFTMELVRGRFFVEHVRASGRSYLEARLRAVMPQLVEGLCALHRAGHLHRDLKPQNVLVSDEGRVKILDFGLVSEAGADAREQSVRLAGTPVYMAPEAISGQAEEASDWYAVGAMLYEALTGRPPFAGGLMEVMAAKAEREPEPLSSAACDLGAEWIALCEELLRCTPAARPRGPEILARLGAATPAPAVPPLIRSDLDSFVGRARELGALEHAFRLARDGSLAVVELHAPSGIGKSTLVRRFLEELRRAHGAEVVVACGRCYEQESVPYKAVDSLVDDLTRYLAGLLPQTAEALLPRDLLALRRLFPVLGRVGAILTARRRSRGEDDLPELRRKGFAALRELLIRLSERSPLVLWIDDLQWGDLDSLLLLREVVRPPDPPALLLVTCIRSEGGSSAFEQAWDSVLTDCWHVRLELDALSREDAHHLAANLLGANHAAGPMAARIAEESGGNPMLLRLLARQAARGGSLSVDIEHALLAELAELPPAPRRVLEVLAAAGQPMPAPAVAEAAGQPSSQRASFDALGREGLLRMGRRAGVSMVEVSHDRVRAAVAAACGEEVLRADRRLLAEILERQGHREPDVVAQLFAAGGERARAAAHALKAAEQAAEALAFDRAAHLYGLALHPGLDAAARRHHEHLQAGALANAGRGREAASLYLALAGDAEGPEAVELRRRAADQLLRAGHVDSGMEVLRSVLSALGMHLPRTARGARFSFLLQSVFLNLRGFSFRPRGAAAPDQVLRLATCAVVSEGLAWIDTARAADFTARYTRLALQTGDAFRVGRGLAALAAFWGFSALPRRWYRRALRVALSLGRARSEPQVLGLARLAAAVVAYGQGHFEDCRRDCARAMALQEKAGARGWERSTVEILFFSSQIYLGRWAAVSQRLSALLEDAEARGDLFMKTHLLTRQRVMARLAEDDPEAASEGVRQAMADWSHEGFHLQHYWELAAKMEIALYTGRAAEEWDAVAAGLRALRASSVAHSQILRIEVAFLRGRLALAAADRVQDHERLAAEDANAIDRERAAWAVPLAAMLRACAATVRGDLPRASRLFTQAEHGLRTRHLLVFAAVCARREGQLTAGTEGEMQVAAADAELRALGLRRPDRIAHLYAPVRLGAG